MPENLKSSALLLIISGPAGSGKTTLCDRMLDTVENVQRVITSTTRPKREGEVDQVDYYFFSPEEFKRKIDQGDFYEHAHVHGQDRYYGTLKEEIQGKLSKNIDLLLNIDVQGAAAFRQAAQTDAALAARLVSIFIKPEKSEVLLERLQTRGDEANEIQKRLKTAEKEFSEATHYDHVIVSGTKEEDFSKLLRIYEKEKQLRA